MKNALNNMIKSQIMTWEVYDKKVIESFEYIKREDFVPQKSKSIAYSDFEIFINENSSIFPPKVDARMIQELNLTSSNKVLEVGTGSGFTTALISSVVKELDTIEIDEDISKIAKKNITKYSLENINFLIGNIQKKINILRQYDAIIVFGAFYKKPNYLYEKLKVGGRLVFGYGDYPNTSILSVVRKSDESYEEKSIFEFYIRHLLEIDKQNNFVF